jgi:hypothetical protein
MPAGTRCRPFDDLVELAAGWGPSSWAWLALALLVAVVARLATRALVPAAEHDQVQPIASPRMPALGAAFAFFTALTLSSEAAYLRSAEVLASDEAAAASRLAWAATSPGVQSEPIQSALRDYRADHPRQGMARCGCGHR